MDREQTRYNEQNPYGESREYDGYGYTGNPFEDMDYDLCKKCHRRKIDRSENSQSVLCKECREEYIKLKVPAAIKITGIVVAAVVVICLVMFGIDIMRFRTALNGDFNLSSYMERDEEEESTLKNDDKEDSNRELKEIRQKVNEASDDTDNTLYQSFIDMADSGMVVSALDFMVDELDNDSSDIQMAITLTDVAMKYSYYDYAAYAIDNYLVDQYVSDEEYDRITGYIDKLEKYYDTVDLVNACWEEASAPYQDTDTEIDAEALFTEYHDSLASYLDDDDYDQALIYYDLYYACTDEEEQIQHLKDCIALDEYIFDAQAQLAVYYRRQREFEKAREILEKAYDVNTEDYTILRALATLELAEGYLAEGLYYAESAYEIYPNGTYVADTYLIALMANEQIEEAEELIREWEDNGYIFDDDFYAFQRGEMTLEEYYTEG